MRRMLIVAATLGLVAVVAIGLSQTGGRGGGGGASAALPAGVEAARLAGSPPPLAALHGQASKLLDGGPQAFQARLAALRGHPVVVNKWASWCPPCRAEFPLFQRLGVAEGRRVAFVGVDSSDNTGDAATFLKQYPVTYPSYKDPDLKVAAVFSGVVAYPTTAFYDARGKLQYIHQGQYFDERKLAADIRRYAG